MGCPYRDTEPLGQHSERHLSMRTLPSQVRDFFSCQFAQRRAARQGGVDSQVSIAQMYEDGDWVPQNYAQAARWYKKAAEHVPDRGGAGVARSGLGFLYMDGHGVSQDYVAAYMYFALSNSKKNMQWAAGKMTGSQIAEAQRGAKEWVQQHPEPQMCAGGPREGDLHEAIF